MSKFMSIFLGQNKIFNNRGMFKTVIQANILNFDTCMRKVWLSFLILKSKCNIVVVQR